MPIEDAEPTPAERMPVEAKARIGSLDALRGVAVLGILAVNAASFALPFMVYDDPALSPFPVVGDNAVARWAVEVFFQQKFIALFSILDGCCVGACSGWR